MDHLTAERLADLLLRVPTMTRRLSRDVFRLVQDQTRQRDLSEHHLVILMELRSGRLPIGEVGRRAGISKSQMTHASDELVRLGMIERQIDTQDRRRLNINLTRRGSDILRAAQSALGQRLPTLLSSLDEYQQRALMDALEALRSAYERFYDSERSL
jgi:DNA-binding MarR family transcriptional regulator